MKKILVIGDVMIDRYTFGEVSRISPEAPVPIVKVVRDEYRLGGAANVAANLASIGQPVHLACVPSMATHTSRLVELCKQAGIEISHDARKVGRLPMKQRIVAHSQQMMRIDDEEEMPPIDGADVERHLDDVALLIISDYGKGSVGSLAILIERCGRLDIPVFVDPKRASWHRYQGASVITPNEQEASDVIGPWLTDGDLTEGICDALGAIRCSNALVTRGARGVSLIAHHGDRLDIPSTAREVFDVTGAGDTVIAMLAAAYVRGYSLADAARIANAAAGIVVGRLGASQISADEFASICRGI